MTRKAMGCEYGSVKSAAALADVDEGTIWKWIKAGLLKSYVLPSGRTRIRLADVVRPAKGAAR